MGKATENEKLRTLLKSWVKKSNKGTPAPEKVDKSADSMNPPAPPPVALDQPKIAETFGNPALTIPGVDVRVTGENVGIKAKRSKARASGATSSGTSQFMVPRSSGVNSLNI